MSKVRSLFLPVVVTISITLLAPMRAAAHCDTEDGPVVSTAKIALKGGDITPLLKWVKPQDEAQIRAAFARTMKVRVLSPEAQQLADTYFFETLVRVHRAGEGQPYTGLKPAGAEMEPGIVLADTALETGSADALVRQLTAEQADNIRQRFARVRDAGKHSDESVEAGRTYVAAYVEFIHYVEGLHRAATAGPDGNHSQAAEITAHQH